MAKPILFVVFLFLVAGMYLVGEGVYIRNYSTVSNEYNVTNATITNIETLKNTSYTDAVMVDVTYNITTTIPCIIGISCNNLTHHIEYNNSIVIHDKSNFVLEIGSMILIYYKISDPSIIKLSVLDRQTGDILIGIGCIINMFAISAIFIICRDRTSHNNHNYHANHDNSNKYTKIRFPVLNDYDN